MVGGGGKYYVVQGGSYYETENEWLLKWIQTYWAAISCVNVYYSVHGGSSFLMFSVTIQMKSTKLGVHSR